MAQIVVTSASLSGDQVTVAGTVDGVPVSVQCWQSQLAGLANKAARQTYVGGLMKAVAQPAVTDVSTSLNGTFTV